MPYMTRQEIIDKYGFDPGIDENQSFFEKKEQGVEDQQVQLDPASNPFRGQTLSQGSLEPDKFDKESRETPSAPTEKMAAAGAIRGYVSDPLLLAGMAVAGLEAAFTDKTFQQSLYKEGGLETVQKHLQEKANEIKEAYPHATEDQRKRELRKYQASPEFFQFHTDQMGELYGKGMKMAGAVNGMLGIDKTPEQETWADDAAQILGSVMLPSPGIVTSIVGRLASATGRQMPRAVDITSRTIDAVVTPGTEVGHYTVPMVAGSAAVGVGINEGVRNVTGEPSVLQGNAFTPRDAEIGGELPQGGDLHNSTRPVDVLGSLAAIGGTVALLSRALRGRGGVDINTIDSGAASQAEQIVDAQRAAGYEPQQMIDSDGTVVPGYDPGVTRNLDQAINENAVIEQVARDAGSRAEERAAQAGQLTTATADATERDVQSAYGLFISRPSRDAAIESARDGVLPDNTRMSTTLREIEELAQGLDQDTVNLFREGMVARAVEDTRLRGLNDTYATIRDIQDRMQRMRNPGPQNPRWNQLDQELQHNIQIVNQRLQDAPASRPNFQGWSDPEANARVAAMMANPQAARLHDMYLRVNNELDQFRVRGGTLSAQEAADRARTPWHVGMFEYRGNRYDPESARSTTVDPLSGQIVVNKTVDPFAGLALKMAMAIDEVQINRGKQRIISALRQADAPEELVRRLGPRQANHVEPSRNTVSVWENGHEVLYHFARESVAEAMKFAPLSLSPLASIANTGRRWFHTLTTGPIFGGIPTAIASLSYDIGAAYTTRRPGRSFGYLGMAARKIAGNNATVNRLIDTLDFVDPTGAIQTGSWILRSSAWRVWGATGQQIMEQAINRNGVLGRLAQDPAMRQRLISAGSHMVRAYEMSTIGTMRRLNALQPHAMLRDTFGTRDRYARYLSHHTNAGRDRSAFRQALSTAFEPYMGLLDNIHNAARYAFFAQNYSILRTRHGNLIPRRELERLAEETRRLAGDIQAIGGSERYNALMSGIPYGNIAAQATRHLYQAAFTRGFKGGFDVQLRLAGIATAGYASIRLAEEMGAGQWFWEGQNEFERVGSILLPTPEAVYEKVTTGQWPTFDPTEPTKHFLRVKLAAELVPYSQAYLAGMEMMGVFDRGANRGRTDVQGDMGQATAQAFNLGNILPITGLLAAAGYKADFMNPVRGRPAMQEVKGPRGEGIHSGQTPGGIPVVVQELSKVFLGLAGDVGIAMTDAGLQTAEAGKDFFEVFGRAFEEGKQRLVDERMPSVPGLWNADDKIYKSNPVGNRIYNIERVQKAIDQQWSIEYRGGYLKHPQAGRVVDPDAKIALEYAHKYLSVGTYKKLTEQRTRINDRINTLEASKGTMSPEQIASRKRHHMRELDAIQNRLLSAIELQEQALARRFGPMFEKYGEPPTLEGLESVIRKATRKTPRQ